MSNKKRCGDYGHLTREGKPCIRPVVRGHTVCRSHGGGQIIAAAKRQLLDAIDPTINRLITVIETSNHDPSVVSACKDLLDRAGLKPADKLQVEAVQVFDPDRDQLSDEQLQKLIETAKELQK